MAEKQKAGETLRQRSLRIARLQKELAAGTYRVNPRKLAAKIVEAHRDQKTQAD